MIGKLIVGAVISATATVAPMGFDHGEPHGTLQCHEDYYLNAEKLDDSAGGEYWSFSTACAKIQPCYEQRARIRAFNKSTGNFRVLSGYWRQLNGQHSEVTRRWDYWVPTAENWVHVRLGSWCQ